MKCADPVLCYTRGNTKLYRNFSLASPMAKLHHDSVFDCGKCIFCRKKRARELAIRCVLHASLHKQNCFLTLTYDETRESYHNNFEYEDIQKFKKKLRRHCEYYFKKKIQVFNVHEYGKNGKKHWHLVVFNHTFMDRTIYPRKKGLGLYTSKTLSKLWPYGFSTIGDVSEASAMYQSQYMQKDMKNGNYTNEKKSHSKHSGIGRDFFYQNFEQILSLGFIPFNGKKIPVPRYFKKLAHKHFSYFYEPDNFIDLNYRKRLYMPFDFRKDWPTKKIADLYVTFQTLKQEYLEQIKTEWEDSIQDFIYTNEKPDFRKSAENYLYDLKNKQQPEKF